MDAAGALVTLATSRRAPPQIDTACGGESKGDGLCDETGESKGDDLCDETGESKGDDLCDETDAGTRIWPFSPASNLPTPVRQICHVLKLRAEVPPTPDSSDRRFGTASPASSPCAESQAGDHAKGKSTESLRTGSCEWWVLRPPEKNSCVMYEFVEPEEMDFTTSELLRGEGLLKTWCGTAPQQAPGPRTGVLRRGFFAPLRRHCAGQRHRYSWHGFDLDLAYITSRIIAMGFPGRGSDATFRNPHAEVVKFLNWAHGDNFRIYNLCAEKSHSSNGFEKHTVKFPCVDHCPPPLPQLLNFCKDVQAWLEESQDHIIVVHCKAGKGRTGTMLCALLIFAGAAPSSYQALRWYEYMRGGKRSGVTIPAQIRWVAMLERWIRKRDEGLTSDPMNAAEDVPHRLRQIRIGPLPSRMRNQVSDAGAASNDCALFARIELWARRDMRHRKVTYEYEAAVAAKENQYVEVVLPENCPVWKDSDGLLVVCVRRQGATCRSRMHTTKVKVWWHHAYLRRDGDVDLVLDVSKVWVDGLQRDLEKHMVAPTNFSLVATFEDLREPLHRRRSIPHFQASVSDAGVNGRIDDETLMRADTSTSPRSSVIFM
mmetsp:Transcript_108953/g.307041  ORF Transcript_108953/g.307041 Transcript_108953/m.307041 type:complete len:599 (-) Transcript_108953:261-2057(-)